MHCRYLKEYTGLGTGGGIYHFRNVIIQNSPNFIFVLHVDICSSFPFSEMLSRHIESSAFCTILGTSVFKDTASNYGCLVRSPDSNHVLHYVDKPTNYLSNLISCGVYLFSTTHLFEVMESVMLRRKSTAVTPTVFSSQALISPVILKHGHMKLFALTESAESECIRLEHDVINELAKSGSLYVYEINDFWCQIKTCGYFVFIYVDFYSSCLALPLQQASCTLTTTRVKDTRKNFLV
jgi:mannose-1-phosphate guanylyltransferase